MQMIINYVVIPGTNTPIFEEHDVDSLLNMPWGDDMTRLHEAIAELTNIDVEGLTKNSEPTRTD